jgi:hypothetical protein
MRAFALICTAYALLAAGTMQATASIITSGCANTNVSCSLNELVNGGSFALDDKTFANFEFDIRLRGTTITPPSIDSTQIRFVLHDAPGLLDPGPGFTVDYGKQLDGAYTAAPDTAGGWSFIIFFNLSVAPSQPSRLAAFSIQAVDADFDSEDGLDPPDGFSQVLVFNIGRGESPPLPPECLLLGCDALTIFKDSGIDPLLPLPRVYELQDPIEAMSMAIGVGMDCWNLAANDNECTVRATTAQYRFAQLVQSIPEPWSLSLLGVGLAAWILSRRRTAIPAEE